MNWRALDLNLLVVFDAVAQDRSVTRAAQRLGMTQTAISHALGRLRQALKDELFLRTPAGMEPTPHARMLIAPVRAALQGLYGALESAEGFDPAVSERMFRIAVDNRAALVLVAPLTSAARAIAPRVRLDVRPSGTLDLPDLLDSGDLDLAIGSLAAPADRFADRSLFRDHFVALLRRGHDAAGGSGAIAPETLAALPHLSISSTGEPTDFVDAALQELGLARTIVLRAPLLAAAAALLDSDMVAVISERAARAFAQYLPLAVRDLPFPSPEVPTAALWHRRFDAAPAHRWLRGIVGRVAHAI